SQRAYYSGKKKAHTLKSQVAVDEGGRVVNVGESRPGRWADLKVFRRSGLAGKLIGAKVGALGDLGDVGLGGLGPRLAGAPPRGRRGARRRRRRGGGGRRRGGGRYTGASARRGIRVGHAIGRWRKSRARSQGARHRRKHHTARVRAVAGLVNRMLDHGATD